MWYGEAASSDEDAAKTYHLDKAVTNCYKLPEWWCSVSLQKHLIMEAQADFVGQVSSGTDTQWNWERKHRLKRERTQGG